MVGMYVWNYETGATGLSLFGMCSFKMKKHLGYFGVVIVIGYLFLCGVTIIYFKRKVPETSQYNEYLRHYTKYVMM